jgi:hypothetical protein
MKAKINKLETNGKKKNIRGSIWASMALRRGTSLKLM